MSLPASGFNLSTAFSTIAATIPDARALVWRDQDVTYRQLDSRVQGVAHYLTSLGLGCHTERDRLAGHESGQDHLGLYLRNGNAYVEGMLASYRARVAPFNVNYRYVDEELSYLLGDAGPRALIYGAEFAPRVAAILDRLPHLQHLIQVADDSDNALLPGAVDYEEIVTTPVPTAGMPTPSGDDLYLLYTGGTTGMPKGVLWRQHDIFVTSMGGRPFGSDQPFASYQELAEQCGRSPGAASIMLIAPLMHGAAQWGMFQLMTMGGWVAIPDDVCHLRADQVLRLAERERVMSIPVVGDAIARPLIDEIESGDYDLSSLFSISNGGAALTPSLRKRFVAALPHLTIIDVAGASESGLQMNSVTATDEAHQVPIFTPGADTGIVADDLGRALAPGAGTGWLARRNYIPLGYLGDPDKTARTFPVIDGERWSVPGDKARYLDDGRIELLGRDSVTINSGGEKIYAEEVERAVSAHPDIYDVVVVGRPSPRWGSEVVAVVQVVDGRNPSDEALIATCEQHIARYKVPKAIVRVGHIRRSPAGKADYRWAREAADVG